MDGYIIDTFTNPDAFQNPFGVLILTVILIWSLVWKGSTLWHASENKDRLWFIALLLVNTMGVLEILYLFFFSKHKITPKEAQKNINTFVKSLKKNSPKKGKS